jgi:hypothetical protein
LNRTAAEMGLFFLIVAMQVTNGSWMVVIFIAPYAVYTIDR